MKRFLVVNPFGMGDAIFSLTVLEALRAKHPKAFIGFLANERTSALVRLDASVDRVHEFSRDGYRALSGRPIAFFRKMSGLLGEIRRERYDTLIDLSLGREFAFYAFCIGIRERIGFDFRGRGIFLTKRAKLEGYRDRHVVDTQLGLLKKFAQIDLAAPPAKLPLSVPETAGRTAAAFLQRHGIEETDRLIAIAPGGGVTWGKNAIYKQWDSALFGEAAAKLAQGGRFKTLFLGDASEAALIKEAAGSFAAPCAIAAGESLETVCALLRRSALLVCNDGGLLHLANALGVKTVSIYGPVDERVYGPYGADTPHAVLKKDVPCRPCYADFSFPPCLHQRRCLTELGVAEVVQAAEKIV